MSNYCPLNPDTELGGLLCKIFIIVFVYSSIHNKYYTRFIIQGIIYLNKRVNKYRKNIFKNA